MSYKIFIFHIYFLKMQKKTKLMKTLLILIIIIMCNRDINVYRIHCLERTENTLSIQNYLSYI